MSAEPDMRDTEAIIEDLPPASTFVYWILEHRDSELTRKDLTDVTRMSGPNVRYGIRQLEQYGLIESRRNPQDGRQRLYKLVKK